MSESWASLKKEENDQGLKEKAEYKDAILFGIELTPYMLERNPEGKLHIQEVLLGIYDSITDLLITSLYDYSGVHIYNCLPKDDDTTDVVVPLGIPRARQLKDLKYLIDHESAILERFEPNTSPISISDVFFSAQETFLEQAPGSFSRRFFWITSNDNPAPNPREKTAAISKTSDLFNLNIRIVPFLLSDENNPFDISLFYEAIRYRTPTSDDSEEPIEHKPKPISALFVRSQIRARHTIKRALFNVSVELGPLRFGVRGFKNVSKQTILRKHEVHTKGEEQRIVHHHSKLLTEKSQKEVKYKELGRYYEVGDEAKIPFTPQEIEEAKKFDDPIIRVLGFKNIAEIHLWQNYTTSTFLYPSETVLKGSTAAFVAFYNSLLKHKRAAIAWTVLTRGSSPSIVAIIPSEEILDQNSKSVQDTPPGLNLVHLPFKEYFRDIPSAKYDEPTNPETVEKTKEIISTLHMRTYDPSRYPNPKLQWFYKILQAHALEEEFTETTPEDKVLPKYKSINAYAGDKIVEWNQLVNREVELDFQST